MGAESGIRWTRVGIRSWFATHSTNYARDHPQVEVDRWYARRLRRSPAHPTGEITPMDTFPDLGSLSDQELKDLIQQLTEEEIDISYKRRILHGKIDILRAELVNRLRKKHEGGEEVITGDDVQKLTDILAGRAAGAEASDSE